MTTSSEGDEPSSAPRQLADLPAEIIERILFAQSLRAIAAANATSRLFRGAPGGRSPVEHALRERARARGHARALLAALPDGVRTWTEELLHHEAVLALARTHALAVAAGGMEEEVGLSAFVDADGGLHTCGEEKEDDDDYAEEEEDGDALTERVAPLALGHDDGPAAPPVRVPTRVASLSAVRVRSVAAGRLHLLALSEAGTVYGCGENGNGQLGLGGRDVREVFELVRGLEPQPVVCIAAGCLQSFALTAAGCAYSWGRNECGQLGHGDRKARREPTRIEALDGVRVGGVSACGVHTLLLSTSGAVYSCGDGQHGRLGHGDQQQRHTPRRIEALAGVRAVHVSAGDWHSVVVDAGGAVYSCGPGACLGGSIDDPRRLTPRRMDALAGVRAVRACSAHRASAVLGADGSVHAFGYNRSGRLGLQRGHGARKVLPGASVHALAHARVVSCALGPEHALFVTADGAAYSCGKQSAALGLGVSTADEPLLNDGDGVDVPERIHQLPSLLCEAV